MKYNIGVTGHSGSLGKSLKKNKTRNKYFFYKYDIRDKKKLYSWFLNNKLDLIIHLAAIVPIKIVNKNRKKAFDVNYTVQKYCRYIEKFTQMVFLCINISCI